jgi:hypothetical protein
MSGSIVLTMVSGLPIYECVSKESSGQLMTVSQRVLFSPIAWLTCLERLFDPPRILHMRPQHRQGPVSPVQHSRVLQCLHILLELVHITLVISQDVVHVLAIERMARQLRELLHFLLVFVA